MTKGLPFFIIKDIFVSFNCSGGGAETSFSSNGLSIPGL